jgi:membrane protease YdiL (CAAX protease family)
VAHLPNPILTVITLFFGLASCLFFIHYRNLVPLAIAHAILGICIGITIPGPVDHNMRVGISYLNYVDRTALSKASLSAKP